MLRTSVNDIAQITGVSVSTVRRLCDKGLVAHKRDYKGWRWFDEPKKTVKQVKSLLVGGIQTEKQS
jgi:DNA-binding transcriptional MerR regulator